MEAARRGGGDLIQVTVGINNSRRYADNNRNPLAFTVVNNTIFSLKGPWDLSLWSFVVKYGTVDTVVIPVWKCGWKYLSVTDGTVFLQRAVENLFLVCVGRPPWPSFTLSQSHCVSALEGPAVLVTTSRLQHPTNISIAWDLSFGIVWRSYRAHLLSPMPVLWLVRGSLCSGHVCSPGALLNDGLIFCLDDWRLFHWNGQR